MATQPANQHNVVAQQSSELASASAQVVAHRVTRMLMAGPLPSARDRKEFKRMVDEKHLAFGESWLVMIGHATTAQVALGTTAWRSLCYPWLDGGATPAAMASQMQLAGIDMIQKGLEPMHRKAVANAKRLAKTPLR
jgi:hypothetical protein